MLTGMRAPEGGSSVVMSFESALKLAWGGARRAPERALDAPARDGAGPYLAGIGVSTDKIAPKYLKS
jgi:hypothetical protein